MSCLPRPRQARQYLAEYVAGYFARSDGVDGVFVFLGDDMPYLFVQVYDIRKQGRGRQMSFTFSPDDVGGLDAEFIEQNITDNPAEAWRSLNGDDADLPTVVETASTTLHCTMWTQPTRSCFSWYERWRTEDQSPVCLRSCVCSSYRSRLVGSLHRRSCTR